MTALASVPDAHRVDPARARRWSVSTAGRWTIVVATCAEEARLLGLLWVAVHLGRSTVALASRCRVREATDADVDRWLTARAQQEEIGLKLAGGKA